MYKHIFSRMVLVLLLVIVITNVVNAQQNTCQTGFRLIAHAMGEACVSEDVQRVVVLEWSYVEDVLALGVMPVGVADIDGYNNWVKIEPQLDSTVVDVGTRQEPNLEVIASLNPDLIIAPSFRVANNYEALRAIAPILVFDAYPTEISHYDEMLNTFTTIAFALNRQSQAESVLSQMQAYFASANQALVDAGRANETFILAQTFLHSDVPTFRLFTDNSLAVQVLTQIGLTNAWDDAPQQYGYTTVNFEAFVDIGDTNFFYIAQPDYQSTLVASPLWTALPFVSSDHVYWLGGDVWLFGGPLSMQVLIDTVLDAMGISPVVANTCATAFRLVIDAMGEGVCVPQNPKRVVALSELDIDALLALGIQPVAVTNGRGQTTPPRYLSQYLGTDVVSTGTFYQPNLEIILAQNPDLILFAGFTDVDMLSQLNAIAPVFNAATPAESWQTHLTRVGEVFNMQAEADSLIQAYDSRIAHLRDSLADAIGDEFVVVRWSAEGPQMMASRVISIRVLTDLGWVLPTNIPDLQDGHAHTPPLSLEKLDIVDVDWVFIGTLAGEGDAVDALQSALQTPLFQALDIVKNNRYFLIDGSIWTSLGGYLGVMTILDDIETIIIERTNS